MTERALILCRQSKTIGATISLEDQEMHCRRWCAERSYDVVGVVAMPDTRGWKEARADHDEARRLAAEKRLNVVVGYDISRIARNVRILETFVHDLARHNVRLELASQPWANSPLMRQVFGAFAEMETTQKADRQKDLWNFLMTDRGRWHGGAPFGYQRLGGTIVPLEDEAEALGVMIELALAGIGSSTRVARELNARGIPTRGGGLWWSFSVRTILTNPAWAGGVRTQHGVRWPGEGETWHEPLYPRETWERVQALFRAAPTVRTKPEPHWLEGLVEHECGRRCYYYTPHGCGIYRCATNGTATPCSPVRREVAATTVAALAVDALTRDLSAIVPVETALEALRSSQRDDTTVKALRALEKRRAALEAERERVALIFRKGRRPVEWFDAEDDALLAELAAVDDQIARLPRVTDAAALRSTAAHIAELAPALTVLARDDPAFLGTQVRELGLTLILGNDGVRWRWPASYTGLVPELPPLALPLPRRRIMR